MAHVAVTVEGGFISGDLIEQIAAMPQDVQGQRPGDFGLDGRLSDEIQKAFSDALAYWQAYQTRLARGREGATTVTRETWILPLLEELGYTLKFQRAATIAGGNSYTISHRLGDDPASPPVHIVSSGQELDRKGNDPRSPHALVQDYLNRSDALWGIVTNGKRLRLLRNTVRFSKPSFVEFDLEAIFAGNLYSEFVLFYRLVHATRLPRGTGDAHECLLERYYQQGIEQGGRVRNRLRDGVREALEILGTGFLAHRDSEGLHKKLESKQLADIDYYRELLRLIYRLLFLMVAEERRLLFVRDAESRSRQDIYDRWYSIERLRKRAESRFSDDGHSDLWEGLKETFRLFEDTGRASQLGLTALDGELFGRFACADLIDTKDEPGPRLRNEKLLAAIWRLSTFEDADGRKKIGLRRRVNFAGLDVEELGSVYESLLEYHPDVKVDGERSKFELVAGSERKSTGSYYTPPELVRELIKSALEPVIEDRLTKAATRAEKERALLSLKICDPASGSGHFMLAAARRLGRELARVRSGEAEPNPSDYRKAVRDVIRRCIYAVDKNALAVDLCKVALWIEGHSEGLPLSFLDHHVKGGDSLVGLLDLDVLRTGVPDDAYKAVTGDDKAVASEIRKRNRADTKAIFRHNIQTDIDRIASAFAVVADLPETTPDEVHAKEAEYIRLRQQPEWTNARSACDLWTAAFFARLTKDGAGAVPTTRHVWDAVGGRLPQGPVAGLTTDLAHRQPFFHWPLEFPEVFTAGGFDVMLGNPPWEVIKLQEKEFFATRDREIADAPNKAARERLIKRLYEEGAPDQRKALGQAWEAAKHAAECEALFVRTSGRFSLTAYGDINTYASFAETFLRGVRLSGRSGFIVPTGIATDFSYRLFFSHLADEQQLVSLIAFDNQKRIFPSVHPDTPFCLLTLGTGTLHQQFAFYLLTQEDIGDERRRFTLDASTITLINPNTRTCPIFRSQADAELTRTIYGRVPILIDQQKGDEGNSWGIRIYTRIWHMAEDAAWFRTGMQFGQASATREGPSWRMLDDARWVPLYEAKMIHQFDHRWATFEADGQTSRDVTSVEKRDTSYGPLPRYWVPEREVNERLLSISWKRQWMFGIRGITNATNERTIIGAIWPRSAAGHSLHIWVTPPSISSAHIAALCACMCCLPLDYIARQKIGGANLSVYFVEQFPILAPADYGKTELNFIVPRVLELTYTAEDMRPFAEDLGFHGLPFKWDSERRALLRAELDAYYAYLYGLTRRELEYILDPKAVMGEDYPSETFRVLKENEIKEFGEYRTQRLVLEAWDRFVADGTFDVGRLRDPQYIDRVADELAATREKLAESEHNSRALLALASASPKPTLFVEGITDAAIVEAAWAAFFPSEPNPVKVLGAGGTKEMGSLAGKGKALREVLGNQVVLVLADNDSAGRDLVEDGHLRKGGNWRQLPNGIHWCLLKPTEGFSAAMKTHAIPPAYWPFTVEAAFAPALRRQALAAGVYRFSGDLQAEFFENPELARRLVAAFPKLGPDEDAYWYLMAPHHEAKEAFAAWVTAPERRTEENYAAFEEIIRGLRDLLAGRNGNGNNARLIRGAA